MTTDRCCLDFSLLFLTLFRKGLTYLKGFTSSMPTLTAAQCLVKCLVNFCKVAPGPDEENKEQVGEFL